MYIKEMYIRNFRNIENLDSVFSREYNVFYGENAQGKTNFLESILLSLNAYSHREKKTLNFIMKGKEEAKVSAKVFSDLRLDSNIDLIIKESRQYYINGEKAKKRQELLQSYSVVLFSPKDLKLVTGSPKDRREFLDESISLLYPTYHSYLKEYGELIKQRNALLKKYYFDKSVKPMIEVYDEKLALTGSNIIKIRIKVLKEIEKETSNLNKQVSKNENISFSYICNVIKDKDIEILKDTYKKALEDSFQIDILKSSTSIGIHHDDIGIYINQDEAKNFASQGQQRSISLCLKLSLIKLLYEKHNEYPIVLLDDVMSDLDENRQKQILKLIKDTQSFITCVDMSFISDIDSEKVKVFNIRKGNLDN